MADENNNVYGHYLRWFHRDIFWEILSLTDVKKRGCRQDASPLSAATMCILYTAVGTMQMEARE